MMKRTMPAGHTLSLEIFLQLSCSDVYKQILSDGSPISLDQVYKDRGEQNLKSSEWQPSEEVINDVKVLETRTIDFEVQLKNNPFVKKAPTLRTIKIIEKSNEKIVMKATIKNR